MNEKRFYDQFNQLLLEALLKKARKAFLFIKTLDENPLAAITRLTQTPDSLLTRIFEHISYTYQLDENLKQHMLSQFETLPFIEPLIDHHLTYIKKHYPTHSIDGLKQGIKETFLKNEPIPFWFLLKLNEFFLPYFPEKDQRQYIPLRNEKRKLRRMDSLARLLSLSSQHSVCTAVAIIQDQLIIAANVRDKQNQSAISDALRERLKQLRSVFLSFPEDFKEKYGSTWKTQLSGNELKESLHSHFESITQKYGIHVSEDEFKQALYKLADALLIDDYTFSLEEKNALLDKRPIILAPAAILRKLSQNNPSVPFSVHHLHAEQLIWYYNKQVNLKSKSPIYIGISKLCCGTCSDLFVQPNSPYIVSGTHNQRYPGVANIETFEQERVDVTPQKQAVLGAKPSPGDTPDTRRKAPPPSPDIATSTDTPRPLSGPNDYSTPPTTPKKVAALCTPESTPQDLRGRKTVNAHTPLNRHCFFHPGKENALITDASYRATQQPPPPAFVLP